MSTQVSNSISGNQSEDFEGLEPLLKESLRNKELWIINYTATKMLPTGENYNSVVLKLDVMLCKDKFTKEETLHLVAKTPNRSEKPILEWPLVFKKERFMYAELRPLYRELERDAGIEEANLIDVWPEFLGYRNSLKNDQIIDKDSALLMKNVKAEGFYSCNRQTGMDVHHARTALTSLARYHALGIAMKQKRPDFAKKAVDQARVLGINMKQLDEGFDNIRRTFIENPVLHKHLVTIESSFDGMRGGKPWTTEPTEPWATITHGDFWTNNMLFHKDEKGNVDDVKFVDFQIYLYNNPLKDLPYFLCGSLDKKTQMDHLDELVTLYYDTFIKTLKRMNCDVSASNLITRESFDREMKKQAIIEFPLCALVIKFFVFQVNEENEGNNELVNMVFHAKPSDVFIDKLKWIIEIYEKMGWF